VAVQPPTEAVAEPVRPDPGAVAAAREAIQQTRAKGAEVPRNDDLAVADAQVSRDDLDADPDNLGGEDLLARELGASTIEEIKHT
jgi:DNA polymerase-3 subunit gamma/tau